MAETAERDSPTAERDSPPDFAVTKNPLPDQIIGGLIVVFILGAVLATVLKPKPKEGDIGIRSVVVPTADRPRTVVVPPCGTGVPITARNAATQATTPGATVVTLSEGVLPRTVLVPRCAASAAEAGASPPAPVPSAVFVLAAGARTAVGTKGVSMKTKKKDKKKTLEPRDQLIVPTASEAEVIVVPTCTGSGRAGRVDVLQPLPESPTTILAPRC